MMKSLSEADRVLKPGGFMIITDFDPGHNYKKPYSDIDDVYSYKQDYASIFTQSRLYYLSENTAIHIGSRILMKSMMCGYRHMFYLKKPILL